MAREFRLPDIGEGLTEAEIVRWLVAEGDDVEEDQPIVEVETDKAVVEIPSPFAGVVVAHGGAEGEMIAVGDVLVTIGEPGESAVSAPTSTDDVERVEVGVEAAPIVGTLSDQAEVLEPASGDPGGMPVTIQALPIVRKLARENDVDLETVAGTGPGGRITRADIEAVIAGRGTVEAELAEAVQPSPEPEALVTEEVEFTPEATRGGEAGEDERRPLTRLRRTIAANMTQSWTETPHVTTFDDADATRLLEVRKALGDRHDMKIPIEALVIKAVLPALDEFPELNATLEGDDLVLHHARDMGIAVDTAEGLMVAVIRDADSRSVLDLAKEIRRLGDGARERTLTPSELTGQTFTVSNIGAVGGGHGTPIIPPGTTAILSVGVARLRPVVYEGDLAIAPVMPLSLSYDHRVIDGAVGRRFMALVLENLEEPALFLAV
ncbi:MAG: dihydrolipoamide acetyltransferase family protein [Acidimicrobiia bacterium]